MDIAWRETRASKAWFSDGSQNQQLAAADFGSASLRCGKLDTSSLGRVPCEKQTMPPMDWKQVIENWRKLPAEERRLRHLRAIPRHVANSMAMENEPVSEQFIRDVLRHRIPALDPSPPLSAY